MLIENITDAITDILRGYQTTRSLPRFDFVVEFKAGACWSALDIHIEDKWWDDASHKRSIENYLERIILKSFRSEEDLFTTGESHANVRWVEDLEPYKRKYFEL